MTKNEIIEMAKQAGAVYSNDHAASLLDDEIIIFAKLVAQHERERLTDAAMQAAEKAVDVAISLEREACAKLCEGINDGTPYNQAIECAEAIRARGQA